MRKLLHDQRGILLISITAGILVLGAVGTVAYSRVKHNQLEQQKNASSLKLQESIADSAKKLATQKEEKKPEPSKTEEKTTAPPPAPVQKPSAPVVTKPAPTVSKPKTETTYQKPTSNPPTGSLSLQHVSANNVAWTLNGSAPYGLKLVWSASPGPVYPGSSAKYFTGASITSATIDASSGNYYVRVCMYHEGSCINYSNEIYINVP